MAFAEANQVLLGLKEESTFGTYPSGNIEEVRYSTDSFGQTTNTTVSNEVRSDRQVPDIIRTGISAQGGWNGELSYGVTAFETAMKGLLGASSAFGTVPTTLTGAIDATASSNKFSSDSSASGIDMTSISVGDWIRTTGFTNDANNGYFQVTAVDTATATDHNITVVGASLVDETGSGDETVEVSAVMRNGTTTKSYAIEKQFLDLNSGSGLAVRVLGFVFGQLQMTLNPQSIATYQVSGQGKQVSDTAGSDLTDSSATLDFTTLASVTNATANDIMNTVDGVGQLIMNRDSPFSVTIQSLNFTAASTLRAQNSLSSGLGASNIAMGRFTMTGNISAYFEDKTLLQEHLLYNETDLAVVTKDGDGNAYLWDLPAIKLGGDGIPKGTGNDQDVMVPVTFDAKRSTRDSQDYMIAVHKFSA